MSFCVFLLYYSLIIAVFYVSLWKTGNVMYKPLILEGRTITFCGKKFQLYSLDGFSFAETLDTDEGDGLYVFTKTKAVYDFITIQGRTFMKSVHDLLYLGRSDELKKRPHKHEKFPDLKKYPAQFLGIYQCEDTEDSIDVETMILESYFFKENTQHNTEIGNRETSVAED